MSLGSSAETKAPTQVDNFRLDTRFLEHHPVTSLPTNQNKVHKLQPTPQMFPLKTLPWGFPWWSSGYDSAVPTQGAWVRFLVGELDPTCSNYRFHMLQRRLGTAKKKKKQKPSLKAIRELSLLSMSCPFSFLLLFSHSVVSNSL